MSYCDCGEDGLRVLECQRCHRTKCEDCATRREVETQYCNTCQQEEWIKSQVWPSLTAVNDALKCERPLAGSGGLHWWSNFFGDTEEAIDADGNLLDPPDPTELGYTTIICKSCGLQLKISLNATDLPEL